MPVMKGLLAPQNTFLDTIATRFDGTRKFAFDYSEITSSDKSLKSCISSRSLRLPWYFVLVIRHCILWCSWEKLKKKKKILTESCLFPWNVLEPKCICFLFIRKRIESSCDHHRRLLEDEPMSLSTVLKAAPAPRTAHWDAHLKHLFVSCVVSRQVARLERTFKQAETQTAIKISTTTSVSALFNFPNEQTVSPLRSRISELRLFISLALVLTVAMITFYMDICSLFVFLHLFTCLN